jgi:anthraniloyl-CoA monooxygenase
MKVVSIGGGPAGLYFSILLKKLDPSHEIRVLERNPPDATFGWGVVFSEQTLGNLREADAESYAAIERAFVRWTDLVIHDRGRVTRSTGHDFCGLSRKRLLAILQSRARQLGVVIENEVEVRDFREAALDADLVVAADGLSSSVRTALADHFQPTLDVRKARYIWLGATRRLPEFTFYFRENGHGLFTVHAYPFDDRTSTFIVETDEETWRNAGLDSADEARSIAYCEALFARELDGAQLLGNRSRWIQFTTVRNAHWHHRNVVLLGDAAHTAHFSIGSGTKLAMEDAIALVASFREHGTGDVPAALEAYERARRPEVERIQRAAQSSLEWFENVKRYHAAFEPLQLAFSLLTRSRRITHANLRARDGALLREVDGWFAARAGVTVAPDAEPPPPMFTPYVLRGLRLRNRVVVSPMCMYSAVDGVVGDFHLVHYGARAMGGAGLVMTEMTDVSADGRITPGCAGLYNDAQEAAWKRIVDYVHAHTGAKIGVQVAHAGRKGSTRVPWECARPDEPLPEGGWELIAPSPIPYHAYSPVPRAMTRADMDRVLNDFVAATRRAARAGFDLLEVHMAHGYLLSSFLTPVSNLRTDEYGGSAERRMRFPLEVFDAMRDAWPIDRPIAVRISASDWVERGGVTEAEVVLLARTLAEHGADIIDVSSGQTTPDGRPPYGRAWMTHLSDLVRNVARVPTITVGGITSADDANTILAAGRADLVALARAHLADPHFTLRAAQEQGVDAAWPRPYHMGRTVRWHR